MFSKCRSSVPLESQSLHLYGQQGLALLELCTVALFLGYALYAFPVRG